MKKNYLLKLAKMLMKFAEVETDNGKLIYEGELAEGVEIFVEDENGEMIAAPNGEYKTEDKVITVEDGKVIKIEDIVVEDPQPEPVEDPVEMDEEREAELLAEIETLKAEIAEKDARIAELEAQIAEKDEQLKMSVEKPAHIDVKDSTVKNKENKALRYFN
jgi:hypothetical protein